jgi:7-carboxy-7-deazaguanine synthase
MPLNLEPEILNLKLPVMEHFYTIQGEGKFQGHAAYFIRLGGCDVGCVWCDVKESWDASLHPQLEIKQLATTAQLSGTKIVVITGGEPAMHNLSALTRQLKEKGLRTHIETSGVYPLTGEWDWVCFSPKKFKSPDNSVFKRAHELKVVIYHPSDFAWAESFTGLLNPACELFLQPEWSKEKQITPLIVDYVKANPKWKISLQTHKYMNIP